MYNNKIKVIMKNEFTKEMRIVTLKHGKCSYYGNPKYYVILQAPQNPAFNLWAETQTNASCAYGISNYEGRVAKVTYHYTKAGKCIITSVNDL